jgi:hypothetical protein
MSEPTNRLNPEHDHAWATWMTITHAPIDPDDPVGHTGFTVLACACGVATVFPATNFILTTRTYRDVLAEELRADGLTLIPAVDEAALAGLRLAVRLGAGHECDEWTGADRCCALCGARL